MDILQLNREQLKRLVELEGGIRMVELLQLEKLKNIRLSKEQLLYLDSNNIQVNNIEHLLEYSTINKIIKYLSVQKTESISNLVLDWLDYLKNCKKLGMDTKSEFVVFPRRLKESHNNITKLVLEMQKAADEINYQLIKEKMKSYEYESKKLKVMVPSSTVEIVLEGQKLHHCVGTYIDKVVSEKTMIFFIRLQEQQEESYYTMEVKDGSVIQVRGKNNCAMTKEVSKFIERFKRVKLQNELKEAV